MMRAKRVRPAIGPVAFRLAALRWLPVLLALAVPGMAQAQTQTQTQTQAQPRSGVECGDEKTQAGMNACFARQLGEADFALNDAYQSIITRLGEDAAARTRLTEAQRAWIRFRDAECAFSTAGTRGGSFHPSAQSQCLTGLTRQRVEAFRDYLRCEEGDLSCPVPPARR